jgi:hypothetical protein
MLSAHAIVGSIIIPTLIRPSSPVNGHIQGAPVVSTGWERPPPGG